MKSKNNESRLESIGNFVSFYAFEIFFAIVFVGAIALLIWLFAWLLFLMSPENQLESFNAKYDYCIAQEYEHDYCLVFAKD